MPSANDNLARFKSEGDLNISPRRKDWARKNIDAETEQWLDEDAKYFLHQSLSTPCLNVLSHCDGIYIEDLQGRRYMDFHGNSVHQVGFHNQQVIDAIKAQLDELPFCTRRYTNIPAIKLAKKLVELAPGDLNRVLFAPGGTVAIGIALKLARAATGRFKTISMWDSFHGASLDVISVGGEAIFRSGIGPLLPGTEHVPPPDPVHCPWECGNECNLKCARYIEYVLEKEGDVGAVIAETVRSTPYIPPPEYWQAIRAACDRHGALLIWTKSPPSWAGRERCLLARIMASSPTCSSSGRGWAAGYSLWPGLIAREGLNVAPDRSLGHYTHEKNPVACAAALATIEYLQDQGLIENAKEIGGYALDRLRRMMDAYEIIGSVRGLGLLLGVELVKNRETRDRAREEAEHIMYSALSKGLSFKLTMGNIITLTPPLTITKAEMDRALDILDECLEEVDN